MTPKRKLIQFIKDKGLKVPGDIFVKRTYARHWQLSMGAWTSYFGSNTNLLFGVGMYRPMRDLSKCPNLTLEYNEVVWAYEIECGCAGEMCEGLKEGRKKKRVANK